MGDQDHRLDFDERMLVLRAQAGDRRAFDELVDLYQERLMYYVRRLVVDAHTTRDVLQDVWLDVYRSLGSLQSPGSFRTWIYRIAHHRAVRHIRHEVVETRAQRELQQQFDSAEECDVADSLANVEQVHAALEKLSLAHREVMVLRYLEEMDIDEIAAVLDCNQGTARSRLHYARLAMRRILEEPGHD